MFVLVYGRDSVRTLAHVPRGVPFGDMFGAGNLPFGLFHTLSRAMPGVGAARATALAMLVLVVSLLAAAIGLWRRAGLAPAVARLDPERQTVLMTGALVMIGCFFSAQNIGYRGVYFLLVLPGLAALGRDQGCPAGPLMRAAAWLAVALMWEQALRRGLAAGMAALGVPNSVFAGLQFDAWVAKELGYWGLVLLFGVLVLAWLARAPLRAAWQRRHATA